MNPTSLEIPSWRKNPSPIFFVADDGTDFPTCALSLARMDGRFHSLLPFSSTSRNKSAAEAAFKAMRALQFKPHNARGNCKRSAR